jgi:hypothetical protein
MMGAFPAGFYSLRAQMSAYIRHDSENPKDISINEVRVRAN